MARLLVTTALAVAPLVGCTPSVLQCGRPEQAAKVPKPTLEYVLVEYRQGVEATPPQVEVKATPRYDDVRTKIHSVAIRLPDSCLNEAASQVSGVSQHTETIFQTTCGPWLSEIEKALANAGYQVFSWDALWKLEKQENLSTYNAGKKLGADIVFVFNSLEAGDIKSGSALKTTLKYSVSNGRGEVLGPKLLDEDTRRGFGAFVEGVLRQGDQAKGVVALSSVLDSTAVLTGNNERVGDKAAGESIWFYRRAVIFPMQRNSGMRFLFARLLACPDCATPSPTLQQEPWKPTRREVAVSPAVIAPPRLSAEDTVQDATATALDPYKAERLQLIRAGAQAFVQSFQEGTR